MCRYTSRRERLARLINIRHASPRAAAEGEGLAEDLAWTSGVYEQVVSVVLWRLVLSYLVMATIFRSEEGMGVVRVVGGGGGAVTWSPNC